MAKQNLSLILFVAGLLAVATLCVRAVSSDEAWSITVKYLIDDVGSDHGSKNLMIGSSSIGRLGGREILACGPWLNRGIGSATISTLEVYLKWSRLSVDPSLILVYAGENDITFGDSADVVFTNYKTLMQKLLERFSSSEIHIIAIKPSPASQSYWDDFITVNSLMQGYAGSIEQVHFHPGPNKGSNSGSDSEKGFNTSSFQDDGIHLTEQGYQLFLSGINQACTKN